MQIRPDNADAGHGAPAGGGAGSPDRVQVDAAGSLPAGLCHAAAGVQGRQAQNGGARPGTPLLGSLPPIARCKLLLLLPCCLITSSTKPSQNGGMRTAITVFGKPPTTFYLLHAAVLAQ